MFLGSSSTVIIPNGPVWFWLYLDHPACIPREHKTKGGFFWTSGQRLDESKCGFQKYNPFVWKLPGGRRQEFGFKYWRPLEPNCEWFKEHCMVIWPAKSYGWNDERCSMKVCPLCEYNPWHFKACHILPPLIACSTKRCRAVKWKALGPSDIIDFLAKLRFLSERFFQN